MEYVHSDYVDTAVFAADAAKIITKRWFRVNFSIEIKYDKSPVTIADQETEEAIKRIILDRHPSHSFVGEEMGATINDQNWTWVVDPIDGTKNFSTGNPLYGTLVALLYDQKPVIGVIDHPILKERWIGVLGQKTTYNGNFCHTRQLDALNQASIYTTTLDMFDITNFDKYEELSKQFKFRIFGGNCYAYGLLANGLTDFVCESDLKPFDYLALAPVIEGAGGIITDWQGNSLTMNSGKQVIAAGDPVLHKSALTILNT